MKKGAIPELNQKWWSKHKAKTLQKTGLGKALVDFQIAERKFDYKAAIKALFEVKKKVKTAKGKCNKKLHAETIAALDAYPKIIDKKIKEILNKLAAEIARKNKAAEAAKKAAANTSAVPKQKILSPSTIWYLDISKEVKKTFDPDWLPKFTGLDIEIKVNADIIQVMESEGTPMYIINEAQSKAAETVNKIIKVGKNAEKAAKQWEDPADRAKELKIFEIYAKAAVASLGKTVKKLPEARWKDFQQKKKQYKDYKIKAGIDVGIQSIQLVGSGVAIAGAAGTGGASLAFGIVGATQGVMNMAKLCHHLAQSAETVQKDLMSNLKGLKKSYDKGSGGAKEVGKTTLNALVGVDIVKSIPGCEDKFKRWDDKVAGLKGHGGKLTLETRKVLKQVGQLEKVMKNAKSKSARKTFGKVTKLQSHLSETLDKAITMNVRVATAEKSKPDIKKLLSQLQSNNPDYARIFQTVFPAAVNLAVAGASGGLGFADAKTAFEFADTAMGLTNDILSEIEDQVA